MKIFRTALIATIIAIGGCANTGSVATAPQTPAIERPAGIRGVENFAQVSPALYRGAQPTREGFVELKNRGIKTIVNLRSDDTDSELLKGLGLRYINIGSSAWRIGDEQVVQFLKVVRDPANQPVFVHCHRGADRTGCAVGTYRIVEQNWPAEAAVGELHRFGFHEIYGGIPAYLRRVNAAALEAKVKSASAAAVGVVE